MGSKKKPLNPGSREAIRKGCTCSAEDNCEGAGAYADGERAWWYSAECKIHGHEVE